MRKLVLHELAEAINLVIMLAVRKCLQFTDEIIQPNGNATGGIAGGSRPKVTQSAMDPGMTTRSAIDSFTEIATLRIELMGSDPLIWRVVEVPTSITLKVLHDIVQVSMGWCDYHLWEMVIDGKTYGLPMDEDFGTAPRKVADRVRLRDVLTGDTTRIDYIYDFGDSWGHSLVVSDVRTGALGIGYPRFVAGERDCPPEDCGGIPGFYEMLEARADPKHPDHADVVEWLDDYDPEELDVFPIDSALGRIAARRNAAAKRIIKLQNE